MAYSKPSHLTALPADIQQLIIAALDAPSPLFIPKYYVVRGELDHGNLSKKQQDYYGELSNEQLASSMALLNWSSTCRSYRRLLGPLIFENLVLRAQAKSLASCTVLSDTDHWQHVTSLVFCGTYLIAEYGDNPEYRVRIDPLEDFDFDQLFRILSNLPPNLRRLTLDFPTEWSLECYGCTGKDGNYLDVFDIDEQPEQTLELESSDNWRKLIFTVFSALVRNDISTKSDFELWLFNIPALPCSVYWSSEFQHFLNRVSHLVLSFSHFDNLAGWNLNTMEMPVNFASRLGTWFWNHLANVKSLSIRADSSWPFGLAPGRCHIPVALPDSKLRFQRLAFLTLTWWFVDSELIALLLIHMSALKNLTIMDYFADNKDCSSSDAENTPTWADFFTALCRHPTLTHLTLFPGLSGYSLIGGFEHLNGELTRDLTDSFRTTFEEVQTLEASRQSMKESGAWMAREDARMKRIWPHGMLDTKYGQIFDAEDYNAERFNEGSDHKAWLELCDTLEGRGGACKVVDVVA